MQFIVGLFIKGVMGFGVKLLTALATEQMIKWSFFKVADAIAKSTSTSHDDEWVAKIKQLYEETNTK